MSKGQQLHRPDAEPMWGFPDIPVSPAQVMQIVRPKEQRNGLTGLNGGRATRSN